GGALGAQRRLAADRRPPGETRARRAGRPHAHRTLRSRLGRVGTGADHLGVVRRPSRDRARRAGGVVRQFPVVLRAGARSGARVLGGREPSDARRPLRRGVGRAAVRVAAGDGLGCGRRVGARRHRAHRPGCARGPRMKTDTPVASTETEEQRGGQKVYLVYASASWIAKRLPTRVGRALFQWAGSLTYRFASGLRATVAANQARVLG